MEDVNILRSHVFGHDLRLAVRGICTDLPAIVPRRRDQCPADDDGIAELALKLDLAMRQYAPAGWKGDEVREKQVLNALFPLMARDRGATQAIFDIIKNQPGY